MHYLDHKLLYLIDIKIFLIHDKIDIILLKANQIENL